jgi:hypothetical protein
VVLDNPFDFYEAFKDRPEFAGNVKFQQLLELVKALLSFPCPCHVNALIGASEGAYGDIGNHLTEQDKINMIVIAGGEIIIQLRGNLIIKIT